MKTLELVFDVIGAVWLAYVVFVMIKELRK